jgi:hypothetical protein
MIRWLVPNIDNFTGTLQLVRLWARKRGLYSSKLGYLGGLSWAILVAVVLQLFPEARPGTAFAWFFEIFARWDWARHVVRICDNGGESWRRASKSGGLAGSGFTLSSATAQNLQQEVQGNNTPPLSGGGGLAGRVSSNMSLSSAFSFANFSDMDEATVCSQQTFATTTCGGARSLHLMPILTPSSPQTDSAASVTHSTRTTLITELARGRSLMRAFATCEPYADMERQAVLFELTSPFAVETEFPVHVILNLRARTVQDWTAWLAFIESRLRKLTTLLEMVPCVDRVRIEPDCRLFLEGGGGHFYVGIYKSAAAKVELAYGAAAREQREAIERTVACFRALHVDGWAEKKPGMEFDFCLVDMDSDVLLREGVGEQDAPPAIEYLMMEAPQGVVVAQQHLGGAFARPRTRRNRQRGIKPKLPAVESIAE